MLNNLANLELYDDAKAIIAELGVDFDEIESLEQTGRQHRPDDDRGRGQVRVSRISLVVLARIHLRTRTVVLHQTLAFQPLQPVRRADGENRDAQERNQQNPEEVPQRRAEPVRAARQGAGAASRAGRTASPPDDAVAAET